MGWPLFVLAVAALVCAPAPHGYAVVVTDDFSDGNDTAGPVWTHLDGYVGSTGQTWDASTGVYRVTAPSNGVNNLGFVGSHMGPSFSDVRVSMDLVEFYTSFAGGPPGPSFPHLMARSNGDNDVAELTGYAYQYDPVADGGAGEVVLARIDQGVDINDIGSQRVTLNPAKDYRFILEVIGDVIHGQIFNLTDGGMVAEAFASIAGAENVYASGTSGFVGYTQNPFVTTMGIDNFRAETAVAGDYNRDGEVDAADYVVWRKTVGQTSPNLQPAPSFKVISFGNMQANGAVSGMCGHDRPNCEVIDMADHGVWYLNFGRSVSEGGGSGGGLTSSVPEPASGVILLMGFAGVALVRRGAVR